MHKFALKDFTLAIETLLRDTAKEFKSVTLFCGKLSDIKQRIRVSRVSKSPEQLIVTFGRLNYQEREYLKLCKKANTNPRKIWLHLMPKKKSK